MTAAFTLIILLAGWAVQQLMPLARRLQSSTATALTIGIGLAGMLVAVVAGVLVSLRLSLGKESQQKPAFTWWVINRLAFLVAASNLASFLLYFLQERFPQLAWQRRGAASHLARDGHRHCHSGGSPACRLVS